MDSPSSKTLDLTYEIGKFAGYLRFIRRYRSNNFVWKFLGVAWNELAIKSRRKIAIYCILLNETSYLTARKVGFLKLRNTVSTERTVSH